MQQSLSEELFPVFTFELDKSEAQFGTIDEIIQFFKAQITAHPLAQLIGTFDHLAHTRSLETGSASEEFLAAQNVIFCFGITLQEPKALAMRPRSIGVAETKSGFTISFLEPPMPVANVAMEQWVKSVAKPDVSQTSTESRTPAAC